MNGRSFRTSSAVCLVFLVGWFTFLLGLAIPVRGESSPDDYVRIKVVDKETGRGVPLVRLHTTNNRAFFTDSQGNVAIHEPGLTGRDVYLTMNTFGYSFRGFLNIPGRKFTFEPGGSFVWEINREMVAERVYRMTGAGLYRDSVLVGEDVPIEKPLLNSKVTRTGQGHTVVFDDRIHWFWSFGANEIDKKLIQFNIAGATSRLPRDALVSPLRGVNLDYFVNENGAPRNLLSFGFKAVNLRTVFVTTQPDNRQRMFGIFERGSVQDPSDRGLAKWDPARQEFKPVESLPVDMKVDVCRHTTRIRAQGREWFYLACPFPTVRVPAVPGALKDLDWYQTFTPKVKGSGQEDRTLEKNPQGDVVWEWKSRTDSVTDQEQVQLVASGAMDRSDGLFHLTDVQTGDSVTALSKSGSVYWNPNRSKWVLLFTQRRGRSILGEVWYAEGDSPLGPWVYTRRVATHGDPDRGYNRQKTFGPIKHHPYLDQQDGRIVYFSGQYNSFATQSRRTPRYTNNDLMYRLDLSDTRLFLPAAVYQYRDDQDRVRFGTSDQVARSVRADPTVRFYALPRDRPKKETVPVWARHTTIDGSSAVQLTTSRPGNPLGGRPVFHALPSDTDPQNPTVVPLFEYVNERSGRLLYSPKEYAPSGSQWQLRRGPVVKVWRSPRLDPPTAPFSKPVRKCAGASAVCSPNESAP